MTCAEVLSAHYSVLGSVCVIIALNVLLHKSQYFML